MADFFDMTAGRLVVIKNDRIAFDTDRRSVSLIPQAAIRGTGVVLSWPDLHKANGYFYNHSGSGGGLSSGVAADSFISWLPQEWGPGRANNLPSVSLGSVPAGIDYLDVRARLTRTAAPSPVFGVPIKVMCKEGAWINLLGGSCPLEAMGDFCRGFEIVLSGTSVLLNLYQSVQDAVTVPWRFDNAEFTGSGGKAVGWTHGAAGVQAAAASGAPSRKGHLVSRRDSKNSNRGDNINMNRTGSNACSVQDNTNYGATYVVDLVITPGRLSA